MISEEAPYNGEESEQRDFLTEAMTTTLSNGTTEDSTGMELFRQPASQSENLKLKSESSSSQSQDTRRRVQSTKSFQI